MNMQVTPPDDQVIRPAAFAPEMPGEKTGHHYGRIVALVLLLAVALGAFWLYTHASDGQAPRRVQAPPVKAVAVVRHTMAVVERTIGTVMPNSTVQVNVCVQGQ